MGYWSDVEGNPSMIRHEDKVKTSTTPSDDTTQWFVEMSQGNPGCLTFLCDAVKHHPLPAIRALTKMRDAGIKGSRLYMLWNDCCNRDTDLTIRVMNSFDIPTIVKHINYEGGRGIEISKEEVDELGKGTP